MSPPRSNRQGVGHPKDLRRRHRHRWAQYPRRRRSTEATAPFAVLGTGRGGRGPGARKAIPPVVPSARKVSRARTATPFNCPAGGTFVSGKLAFASPTLSLLSRVCRPPGQHHINRRRGGLVRRLNQSFCRGMPLGCRFLRPKGQECGRPMRRRQDLRRRLRQRPSARSLSGRGAKRNVRLRGGHTRQPNYSFRPGCLWADVSPGQKAKGSGV
jgi:hypothetical protein